jgi:hypothetical protein
MSSLNIEYPFDLEVGSSAFGLGLKFDRAPRDKFAGLGDVDGSLKLGECPCRAENVWGSDLAAEFAS